VLGGGGPILLAQEPNNEQRTIQESAREPPAPLYENLSQLVVPSGQRPLPKEQGGDVQAQGNGGAVQSDGLAGKFP
jgi:hypothetical protein